MPIIFTNSGCVIPLGNNSLYIYNSGSEFYKNETLELQRKIEKSNFSSKEKFKINIGTFYRNKINRIIEVLNITTGHKLIKVRVYFKYKIWDEYIQKQTILQSYKIEDDFDSDDYLKKIVEDQNIEIIQENTQTAAQIATQVTKEITEQIKNPIGFYKPEKLKSAKPKNVKLKRKNDENDVKNISRNSVRDKELKSLW